MKQQYYKYEKDGNTEMERDTIENEKETENISQY